MRVGEEGQEKILNLIGVAGFGVGSEKRLMMIC